MRRILSFAGTRPGYAILLSLACAAIVVTAMQSYRAIDRELTDAALSRRAAVAQLAAATLSEKLAHHVDVTLSLATRVRFRDLVSERRWVEASAILRAVPVDFPFVDRLLLVDLEGTLMADVPAVPAVRGTNFAYRDWYKGVRRDWRPYVSPVYKRLAAPQLHVFAIAVPIRSSSGDVSGILVLQVRSDTYFDWARSIDIGAEGFVYVVDSKAQIAFHSKRLNQDEIVDYSAEPIAQKLLRGERGVEIGFDSIEHEESILAYAPVAGHGWGVVAQQPTRTALADKNEQLRLLLIAYGLTLFFFAAGIYLAARMLLQRRQAEENRRIKAELERRVAERTVQLEAANKELESFSYSISHDLRSPLRAIDGFSRMLEEDYAERLDREGRRLLGVIRDNARRMGALIDDLLAFSKLGRQKISSHRIDMSVLAREAWDEIRTDAAADFELAPLPAAWGDRALLKQVWANLLSNGLKYSGKRDRARIKASGREDGKETVYCVSDNGVGFDMRYYDKLFGVFQRLHNSAEFPGTGVGLAIVHRVITRHGGRVWAESGVGEGARFYFSLPMGASNE